MDALNITCEVMDACGLAKPATIENGNDSNVIRTLSAVKRAISMIAAKYNWNELRRNISFKASINHPSFNSKTGGFELKKLAPDFDAFLTEALYEKSSYNPIYYLRPDDFLKVEITGISSPSRYFTLQGGAIKLLPKPTQSEDLQIIFDYKSNCPVISQSGEAKKYFSKDDDTFLLDEELLILGGIYKLKQDLSLDYAQNQADFNARLEELKNNNLPPATISPTPKRLFAPDNPNLSARGER